MIKTFRWLVRITAGMILLVVAAFALAYYFASRSLPDYSGRFSVDGVSAPVEIARDTANVPHIFAQSDADAFYGLGFAHAQDRMWQMILMRRQVQGRMAELFGRNALESDKLMRRLDLYRLASSSVAAQDARTQAALEAYSAGVNAWLAEVNSGARGRGAPEMWLYNHAVAPWQPADSLALIKLMALQSASSVDTEVLRARVSLLLRDPDRVEDLFSEAPGSAVVALPRFSELVPSASYSMALASSARAPEALYGFRGRELANASNVWAAAPSRSASGSTLLASDPHMAFTAPAIWYLARLELQSGGVIGGSIPGIPAILTGRNADMGWGLTTAYADDMDVYLEEVNPKNATEYRTPDGWKSFESRDSIIRVRDEPAVTLKLQWTDNGPVLPPEHFNLGTVRPPGHVTVMAWTALSAEDTTLSAMIGMMTSATVQQMLDASRRYVAPVQNLVMADRNRIALTTIGAVPLRDAAHQSQGRLPVFGYRPENRWRGLLEPTEMPRVVQPDGGLLGNTNSRVSDAQFPRNISFSYGDTQRVQRWRKLMQEREVHTRESFIGAQLDTVSTTARTLLPLIGADLWFTGEAAEDGTPDRQRQRALKLLSEWNGEMNEHLPEPLLYAAWLRFLQDRLIRDELGPLADAFTHPEPLFLERVFRDIDGAAAWCDVVQSAPKESCTDISRIALDEALLWIGETYGTALESLRWGDAHEAVHKHPTLGDIPVLAWFVNIHQSTSGGDNTLLRGKTRGTGKNPFVNIHGAGYRGVYDFADPDSSVFVISTGQSGHPLSRYYDDLGELWRRGEYVQMSLDPVLARAASVGVIWLEPRGASNAN